MTAETSPQKNRFLKLDGDKLGQPGWKGFLLSSAFVACAGTGLASYITQHDTKLSGNPVIYTALISSVLARKYNRTFFSPELLTSSGMRAIPQDALIDTRPTSPQTPRQKESQRLYRDHAYKHGIAISLASTFATTSALTSTTLDQTSAMMTITLAAPFFAEGIGMIERARSFKKKGWEISSQKDILQQMPNPQSPA